MRGGQLGGNSAGLIVAYNRQLSHLISRILTELKKEEESVCLNTEEILVEFREVNKDTDEGEMVLGRWV